MKRAFLKHIFEGKHKLFVSSMQQLLKNYNRMRSLFSAFLISALIVVIFSSSSGTICKENYFAGNPPVIVIPPVVTFQSTTIYCQNEKVNDSFEKFQNMHVLKLCRLV